MLERYVHAFALMDLGSEEPAATRERLKDNFPRGATRRMTQLGMAVGSALNEIQPRADDAMVYASSYGESRALEGYLESFPSASPTLFQTSIHPSAVQQALIARQHPLSEFFPMTGRAHLIGHAAQAALLSPAARVILCGGEERGTWLLECDAASGSAFAFALALRAEPEGAKARLALVPTGDDAVEELTTFAFYQALNARQNVNCVAAPGLRLLLEWR